MAAESGISVEAFRHRRRRAAMVVGLISALFASVLVADLLFNGDRLAETAWTSDTVFPGFAEHFLGRHGVTVPIGRTVIPDRQLKGEGGPEDPGPYIKEDRIQLAGRHDPIHVDAISLPGRVFGRGGHFVPNGGASFGGGGGGGGPGGGIITCEKPGGAARLAEIGKVCPGTPEKGDSPGSVVTDTTSFPGDAPAPTGLVAGDGSSQILPISPGTGGSGTPQTPAQEAVSSVPEPASWAMLIAGFLLMGLAIRRHGVRSDSNRRPA